MASIILTKSYRKKIAGFLLLIMSAELIVPNVALALSSGPVQPEISSFEPVGTTDMVDLFTGDFVYNIPLLDVEGYPINISYHGGVTMDQEASWVGLGWNINPGAINRAVRGLPDEFDGELIEKELNINPEITKKFGLSGALEVIGLGEPKVGLSASLGGYLNMSNYRGMSVDFTTSVGVNTKVGIFSGGFNIGASVGSQAGASINYNGSLGVALSTTIGQGMSSSLSFNSNKGGVYSPRTGMHRQKGYDVKLVMKNDYGNSSSFSTGTSVPIGLQNYTAALTNASSMYCGAGQIKLGGELAWMYASGKCYGSITTLKYDPDGSRNGYGYFHLANATDNDLLDFSREKDGLYNMTMQLLPQTHLTYDVYSVNGQGTGGSFRPFRNDVGSVFDPYTESSQHSIEGGLEGGLGDLFSVGAEISETNTKMESGPWKGTDAYRQFKKPRGGSYEDIYFKEAGELTENNESYLNTYANATPITPEEVRSIPNYKTGSDKRITRANHIYTVSGEDSDAVLLLDNKQLLSYTDTTGFKTYPNIGRDTILRVSNDAGKALRRKANHVTEIVQTQKDGRRYVYGLPVVNNVQREVVFAVDPSGSNTLDTAKNLVSYTAGTDDSKNNTKGIDHYYSSTVTPTYTAAHLLTAVLSSDYIDVTGNGISEDDLGTYTKFNYSRKSSDYRWRAPIYSGKAQYIPGYKVDKRDDKASYMIGSREQWLLHSVETKNYVAEFYVSERKDALGALDRILNGGLANSYDQAPYNGTLSGSTKENKSYKLDSIVLYNKHDRFINAAGASPIKTILFTYDYSLCKNLPNATGGEGKLTLKKVQMRYGRSNLNMSAAYSFNYSTVNPDYDAGAQDKWGVYKPNVTIPLSNFDFPFTTQSSETNDYASAWSLTEINLPSGGVIKVDYESDDYAYVQNKEAMEMFTIKGFGNTTTFKPYDQLYQSTSSPNRYVYFKRRKETENPLLSPKENYLKGTNILYYNVSTEISPARFEPIKGYAEALNVGYCDEVYGFVELSPRSLQDNSASLNPITYTALNVGRYSLSHVFYPGSDPESSDMDNIVAGLKASIKELFQINQNPLRVMVEGNRAKRADYTRSFIRLTSPGLQKKGGGHRVKSVKFYDSWDAMAGGNEAVYGKNYAYTLKRDDGKGLISSGVASYEPMIGGDEIPLRHPTNYIVQEGNKFPPNDPVELYQETPIGEGFYPGAVVGYSNVVVTSINKDVGRSSQTEDIHGFYTAKDFPIKAEASKIKPTKAKSKFSWNNVSIEQEATQGFAFVFNDMHGKPRNTENWMLKPTDTVRGRELIRMQQYEYLMKNGKLDNMVPVFDYNANAGKVSVANHKMGVETDLSFDTRMRREETGFTSVSVNLNTSMPFLIPIPIPLGYPFAYKNIVTFHCATATKVTQQYGILNKVISSDNGAVVELRNEVFDKHTGNALVTSVNNEFGDREYSVAYPAYWAYKELGPCYENFNMRGTFNDSFVIDSLGSFAPQFVNYNPSFSTHYTLPSNMPVVRVLVDDKMPQFKLGDEMILDHLNFAQPIKTWTMGYTSNTTNCYIILAPREPYKLDASWYYGAHYDDVRYRVTRSGNKNRLGETIQSYTTNNSTNIFPYLKDSIEEMISFNAQTYKYNRNQVFAANQSSDSLNPFTTGKVGEYRPEKQIINLKNRTYSGGMNRTAGLFSGAAYWKTEHDTYPGYCPDSLYCIDCPDDPEQPNIVDSFALSFIGQDAYGNDSIEVTVYPHNNTYCTNPNFKILGYVDPSGPYSPIPTGIPYSGADLVYWGLNFGNTSNAPYSFIFKYPSFDRSYDFYYNSGCNQWLFTVNFDGSHFTITNTKYQYPGTSTYVTATDFYKHSSSYEYHVAPGAYTHSLYRIRKKIYLGQVGYYDGVDNENWVKTQEVTKYNWFGQEIENKEEGIGYNAAIYGYNQQLPMCVAKNAKHSEVLYEGFEDFALLKARPDQNASYMPLLYSPFEAFFNGSSVLDQLYKLTNLAPSGYSAVISQDDAHTGTYAIKVSAASIFPLNATEAGMAENYSFKMSAPRKYIVSLWLKPLAPITDARITHSPNGLQVSMDTILNAGSPTAAYLTFPLTAKSNIIEGWQKFEASFDAPVSYKDFKLHLPGSYYYDDIRIFPFESNSKGFVYDPVTRKLMATLDENNYATFYEYDAEGNLVRTKKETEKGILTISESRSSHQKNP